MAERVPHSVPVPGCLAAWMAGYAFRSRSTPKKDKKCPEIFFVKDSEKKAENKQEKGERQ